MNLAYTRIFLLCVLYALGTQAAPNEDSGNKVPLNVESASEYSHGEESSRYSVDQTSAESNNHEQTTYKTNESVQEINDDYEVQESSETDISSDSSSSSFSSEEDEELSMNYWNRGYYRNNNNGYRWMTDGPFEHNFVPLPPIVQQPYEIIQPVVQPVVHPIHHPIGPPPMFYPHHHHPHYHHPVLTRDDLYYGEPQPYNYGPHYTNQVYQPQPEELGPVRYPPVNRHGYRQQQGDQFILPQTAPNRPFHPHVRPQNPHQPPHRDQPTPHPRSGHPSSGDGNNPHAVDAQPPQQPKDTKTTLLESESVAQSRDKAVAAAYASSDSYENTENTIRNTPNEPQIRGETPDEQQAGQENPQEITGTAQGEPQSGDGNNPHAVDAQPPQQPKDTKTTLLESESVAQSRDKAVAAAYASSDSYENTENTIRNTPNEPQIRGETPDEQQAGQENPQEITGTAQGEPQSGDGNNPHAVDAQPPQQPKDTKTTLLESESVAQSRDKAVAAAYASSDSYENTENTIRNTPNEPQIRGETPDEQQAGQENPQEITGIAQGEPQSGDGNNPHAVDAQPPQQPKDTKTTLLESESVAQSRDKAVAAAYASSDSYENTENTIRNTPNEPQIRGETPDEQQAGQENPQEITGTAQGEPQSGDGNNPHAVDAQPPQQPKDTKTTLLESESVAQSRDKAVAAAYASSDSYENTENTIRNTPNEPQIRGETPDEQQAGQENPQEITGTAQGEPQSGDGNNPHAVDAQPPQQPKDTKTTLLESESVAQSRDKAVAAAYASSDSYENTENTIRNTPNEPQIRGETPDEQQAGQENPQEITGTAQGEPQSGDGNNPHAVDAQPPQQPKDTKTTLLESESVAQSRDKAVAAAYASSDSYENTENTIRNTPNEPQIRGETPDEQQAGQENPQEITGTAQGEPQSGDGNNPHAVDAQPPQQPKDTKTTLLESESVAQSRDKAVAAAYASSDSYENTENTIRNTPNEPQIRGETPDEQQAGQENPQEITGTAQGEPQSGDGNNPHAVDAQPPQQPKDTKTTLLESESVAQSRDKAVAAAYASSDSYENTENTIRNTPNEPQIRGETPDEQQAGQENPQEITGTAQGEPQSGDGNNPHAVDAQPPQQPKDTKTTLLESESVAQSRDKAVAAAYASSDSYENTENTIRNTPNEPQIRGETPDEQQAGQENPQEITGTAQGEPQSGDGNNPHAVDAQPPQQPKDTKTTLLESESVAQSRDKAVAAAYASSDSYENTENTIRNTPNEPQIRGETPDEQQAGQENPQEITGTAQGEPQSGDGNNPHAVDAQPPQQPKDTKTTLLESESVAQSRDKAVAAAYASSDSYENTENTIRNTPNEPQIRGETPDEQQAGQENPQEITGIAQGEPQSGGNPLVPGLYPPYPMSKARMCLCFASMSEMPQELQDKFMLYSNNA